MMSFMQTGMTALSVPPGNAAGQRLMHKSISFVSADSKTDFAILCGGV